MSKKSAALKGPRVPFPLSFLSVAMSSQPHGFSHPAPSPVLLSVRGNGKGLGFYEVPFQRLLWCPNFPEPRARSDQEATSWYCWSPSNRKEGRSNPISCHTGPTASSCSKFGKSLVKVSPLKVVEFGNRLFLKTLFTGQHILLKPQLPSAPQHWANLHL